MFGKSVHPWLEGGVAMGEEEIGMAVLNSSQIGTPVQVLILMSMIIQVFWDVTPCWQVELLRVQSLHLQGQAVHEE
jgi:hypothetical protein